MKGKLKKSVKRNEIIFSSNRSSLFESTKLRKKMGEEKKKKKRRGRKIGREIGLERIQYTVKIME